MVLLVEVSNTTAAYDLGDKALTCTLQAGVPDYWVVLVNEVAVVRHREANAGGLR